ncbi:MAG: RNA polymerase sigma factor RpoD/SigA [Anaerolineae bacterium]
MKLENSSAQKDSILQQLLIQADEQGYLTADEILELLPEVEDHLGALEELYLNLEEEGIPIYANGDVPAGNHTQDGEEVLPDLAAIPSDDTISLYFGEIRPIPLLTAEQEVDLAKRIEKGEKAARQIRTVDSSQVNTSECEELQQLRRLGEEATHILVQSNSRLVISIAKKYTGQGVPFLDLIQEGNLGLMKAAEKFDHRLGNRFSTYATWWIRQSITRALADQGRTIRVPVHMNDRIRRVYGVAQSLEQELERKPSPEEIALEMGLSPRQVQQALRASHRPLSLEKPVGEEGDSELGQFVEDDRAPDPVEEASLFMLQADVEEMLHSLTPREERILRMRYGLGGTKRHTLKQVGKKFGLTRERIRQIEQEALRKLRHPRRSSKLRSYLS